MPAKRDRMLGMTRGSAAWCLIVLSLLMGAPAVGSESSTDGEPDDGAITWTVRPSDGQGEDGRSWVELDLEPGGTAEEHMLIRNLSRAAVTFTLTAADGYFTDSGRFAMLTSDRESVDAGAWITIQERVEVPSGSQVIVPFLVTVPQNATPGDHPAGVAASIRSGDDTVGVESRVGFRVMTRVAGEIAPAASADLTGSYTAGWNPFEAGSLDVDYTVANTGNTRLATIPQITATAFFGLIRVSAEGEEIIDFAPGETRSGSVALPGLWPLFVYDVDVHAGATTVGGQHPRGVVQVTPGSLSVPAIPWPQLTVAVAAAVLLWWLWIDRRLPRAGREGMPGGRIRTVIGSSPPGLERGDRSG